MTLSQVVPGSAWSTERAIPRVHRIGVFQYEGGMDLGEQDRPKGRSRSLSIAGTASDILHLEYLLITQLPLQRGDHAGKKVRWRGGGSTKN